MTKEILAAAMLATASAAFAWQPAGDKIMTSWGENLDPDKVWQEYPRPIMERPQWQNLNGLWQYAIVPVGQAEPETFQGEILVPFCAESALSGVGKEVGDKKIGRAHV